MSWIAGSPTFLEFIEVGEKPEPLADPPFPLRNVDRLRELADGLGREVSWVPGSEDVSRRERLVSASIVEDVTPYLQDPETADDGLVDRALGELSEVVHVSSQRHAPISGELLRTRLGLGDHWQDGQFDIIVMVDLDLDEPEALGGEYQGPA